MCVKDSCPEKLSLACTKRNVKPWINNSLKNACSKKNFLYRKYLCKKTERNLRIYKTYKNKLVTILRVAEKQYYEHKLFQYKGDLKLTWKTLNLLIHKKARKMPSVSEFLRDGQIIKSNRDIANGFNNFFVQVGPQLADKIVCDNNVQYTKYLELNLRNSIFLEPVTESEVFSIVNSFKGKQSCDTNNISMFLVKNVIDNIVKPLNIICNLSLKSGIFPDSMKVAKVLPIFKNDDPKCFSNYRPVSLLPQFSKILEKIFNNKLVKYLNKYNIICDSQYGFRQNHSTELAILEMVEKITDSIDKKRIPMGIFIDLKKAFDTIDHEILVNKLKFYGIRGVALDWLKSYLNNRKQYVNFNGTSSDMKTILCGIPQGSILGPTLFLLFINDICNVSKLLKFVLFADDTNIFLDDVSLNSLKNNVNQELENLNLWFQANKLSLNVKKTKYIVFGHNNRNLDIHVKINNEEIERVQAVKFLGIFIDNELSWKPHISHIETKISRSLGIFYKIQNKVSDDVKLMLYKTLILPHMMYCCSIWGNNYKTRLKHLIVLQKRLLRVIASVSYYAHTTSLFFKYGCLKFEDLVKYCTNKIVFKAYHNMLPRNMQLLFTKSDQIHMYVTRQKLNMYKKYVRTNIKTMSLSVTGVKCWNELDNDIKLCNNCRLFNSNLKYFYINRYNVM